MVSIPSWRGPIQGAEDERGLAAARAGEGGWNQSGRAAVRASWLEPVSGLAASSGAVAVTAAHVCQFEELRAGSNFL